MTANRRIALDTWQAIGVPAGSAARPSDLASVAWIDAAVPGTAAGALRAAGAWSWDDARRFDAEDWWWRTRITGEPGDAVLGFDGVATLGEIWLDGECVATTDNMFVAHELPIALTGQHELAIRCRALAPELAKKRPRPRWRVPMLDQQQLRWIRTTLLGRTPGWSPPVPAVGPWRAVWLERRALRVGPIALDARLDGGDGVVAIRAELDDAIDAASIVVERDGARVIGALVRRDGAWHGIATVASPVRWWPHSHGEPARYNVTIEATARGEPVAIDLGAIGFRTIDVIRDGGDFGFRVNGVPVFCRGACWTPLDVVTLGAAPEAYRAAVEQARDAGMNMIRVGGTMVYEDDAFYDALDEAGVLLWQDLMFANMDYPDDAGFVASVAREVDGALARLQARPCLAIVCGNSEVEQQAAMWGAERARWSPALFHEVLPARVAAACPGVAYTPSSAHGGAFPHAASSGATSYYGVGAYLRPIDDARRAEVRFASECLAFAHVGSRVDPALRVHHAAWKARAPRDLGAGWDFDDVRDHYVQRLFGVDPVALRATDHDRYLALGRVATGEVMAQVFAEWRRARSITRGGLMWFLRDLWPGAGWGVVDADGAPKPAWYAVRRALAPIAIAITDEGVNGLAIHVVNDRPVPLAATLAIALYRAGDACVGTASTQVTVGAHAAIELAAAALFDGWLDLSAAYRFGPPVADVVHASLDGEPPRVMEASGVGPPRPEAFWFPAGLPATREPEIGLDVEAVKRGDDGELVIRTRRFAQSIAIDAPGFRPEDDHFHLAPGGRRTIALRRIADGPLRGMVGALNALAGVRFEAR